MIPWNAGEAAMERDTVQLNIEKAGFGDLLQRLRKRGSAWLAAAACKAPAWIRLERLYEYRYNVSILSVAVALMATLMLHGLLQRQAFLFFFAAVAISAGSGGLRPGIIATALSILGGACLYGIVGGTQSPARWLIPLGLFGFCGLLISVLIDGFHVAQHQAELAKAQAESAAQRARFLAEASTTLDASLDYRSTLRNIAELTIPLLADWCVIDLLEEGDLLRRLVVAHTDRARAEAALNLGARYPADRDAPMGPARVASTGQAEIYPRAPERLLQILAEDTERLALLRQLGFQSYMCVPLEARGRPIGVMTFARSDASTAYMATDIIVAKDIALRAALAVDNARLYQAAQQEIAERKRAELHIEALNARLQRAMTETHHRVKNNLQVIAAMVDMRMMEGGDTFDISDMERLGRYIRTLAGIHDILTQEARADGEARFVSAQEVLTKLFSLMETTLPGSKMTYHLQDARLTARQATSLALVANELISNAVKHGKRSVEIVFSTVDGQAALEVRDDGQGFPEGFDPAKAANTGLDLVENLTRLDLGGMVQYKNHAPNGGTAIVTLPLTAEGKSEAVSLDSAAARAELGP
ncbi:MAG TPA: histidine kinase dimerization/phosphoacceptor domain -containing protein [Chthonomonadales bacterium]|nr:histidine kinase dimerization/phosphoacceptor domain -containing protein [Chthonomonadales bacterium]